MAVFLVLLVSCSLLVFAVRRDLRATVAALVAGPVLFAGVTATVAAPSSASTDTPPPMVTLLFSRSQLGDVYSCKDVRTPDVVWMDTTVAPELQRRGLRPTGTVETTTTGETTRACLHYKRTLAMSWADMANYRDNYGWQFVSHGVTRQNVTLLDDTALRQEVGGSLQALQAHGHTRASGMYAYQNNKYTDATQAVVREFYDFGRTYKLPVSAAVNTRANVDPQRFQWTNTVGGGYCKATTPASAAAACTASQTLFGPDGKTRPTAYKLPTLITKEIAELQAGEWLTLQNYVFVTGSRLDQWDCTSADPKAHWTTDSERYCWNDYLSVLDALAARPDIVTTDPYSVARAWYPEPTPEPTTTPEPTIIPEPTPTTTPEPIPTTIPEPVPTTIAEPVPGVVAHTDAELTQLTETQLADLDVRVDAEVARRTAPPPE